MNLIPLPNTSDKPMWDIWMSNYQFSAVTVADEIGLFKVLKNKKVNIDILRKNLNINILGIKALANILVCLGLLTKTKQLFSLNKTSKTYLLPDSPFYWGAQFQGFRERIEHKRLKNALLNSATQLSFSNKSFSEMWKDGSLTEAAAYDFTQKMHATIFAPALNAVKSGVFSATKKLLDMGGGSGCFSIAYIKKYRKSKAAVFELPTVCEITKKYLESFNASDKIDVLPEGRVSSNLNQHQKHLLFKHVH